MTGLARSFFGKNGGRVARAEGNLGITPLQAVQGKMPEFVERFQTLPEPNQSNRYKMEKLKAASAQRAENMKKMVSDAKEAMKNMVEMHKLGAQHQQAAMEASKKMAEVSANHQIAYTLHGTHVLEQHGRVEGVRLAMSEQRRNELYGS